LAFSDLGIDEKSFPRIAGEFSGPCVVVGSAGCVWDDLERLGARPDRIFEGQYLPQFGCVTVNDMVMHYPGRVYHAYSNDRWMLGKWAGARRPLYRSHVDDSQKIYLHCYQGSQDNVWPWPGHGSSGLGAVFTALALGYDPVIICGVPLDDSNHYFEPPRTKANFTREVPPVKNRKPQMIGRFGLTGEEPSYWENAARVVFQGRVKSMSGRTRELLGAP